MRPLPDSGNILDVAFKINIDKNINVHSYLGQLGISCYG
jgi:hypothetical protein